MLLLKPNWASKSNFPYFLFAYLLIFVQGEMIHSFFTETKYFVVSKDLL